MPKILDNAGKQRRLGSLILCIVSVLSFISFFYLLIGSQKKINESDRLKQVCTKKVTAALQDVSFHGGGKDRRYSVTEVYGYTVDDVTRYFSIYSSTRNKAGYFTEKTRDCYINPDKPDEIYIPAKADSYYAMRNSSVIFAALGMAFLGMALLIRKNRRFTDTERVVEEGKTLIDRNERIKVHIKGRHILLLLAVVSVFGSLVVLGKAVPGELRYRHLKSICTEERVADLIDSNRTYAGRGRYRIEAKYDLSEGECRIVDTISYVSTLSNNEDVAKSRTYMINPQNENEYYLPLVMDGYLLGIIMGFVFLGTGLLEGIIYLCIRRNNHISKM